MKGFSDSEQLEQVSRLIRAFWLLPEEIRGRHIPGGFLERVLARVHGGHSSGKYDFVDVVGQSSIGWQVKSTKRGTPITWKRAKIERKEALILATETGSPSERKLALQVLGDAIIRFCNDNISASFRKYSQLETIQYARLIHQPNDILTYFERPLVTRENPTLFHPADFVWEWHLTDIAVTEESIKSPRLLAVETENTRPTKERAYSLGGTYLPTQQKWWSWHGKSENQLHFSGEKTWWPQNATGTNYPVLDIILPSSDAVLGLETLLELVSERLDNSPAT